MQPNRNNHGRIQGRGNEPAYKRWYKTARWQRLRAAQLAAFPLCAMHSAKGETVIASVCDHEQPHRGDETKFWAGPFQSLCAPCHNSDKQRIENGSKPRVRIGLDGWPEE